jgi:hypothetical protein
LITGRLIDAPGILSANPVRSQRSIRVYGHTPCIKDHCRTDRFLKTNGFIDAIQRRDGLAALPTPKGIAFLDSHISVQKEKRAWPIDRRIALYGVIAALISAAVAVMAWLSTR